MRLPPEDSYMLPRILGFCIVVAMFGGPVAAARAQFGNSTFGNSGFGGMRSMGTSGFGGSGFGNSAFGMSGFGNSGFGSGFGMNGFSGLGGTGFNSMFGMGGTANPLGGSGLGGGYGGGQMFVGRDAADMQATFTQMGQAQTQFLNQMTGNMNRSNNRNRQVVNTSENPPQPMRVEIRTAFAVPRVAPTALAGRIQTRLQRLAADHKIGRPTVTMVGDTAVIGGVAESESQRMLVEQLVSLEAGVRDVRNEMTVAATPSGASGPPAGN
jgi:hypothetical protein